jgi:anti-repressor protein
LETNELRVFEFETTQVRTQIENGVAWFAGKDICKILDISNSRDALSRLDDDEKLASVVTTSGQGREMTFINESGLYALILTSRKPEAKKFKKWVTSEVLPQIRKTGGYIPIHKDDDDLTVMCRAHLIMQRTISSKSEIIATQEKVIAEMSPKADGYDQLASSKGLLKIGQIAKTLEINRNSLFKILRDSKVLMHNNEPYKQYMTSKQDYFRTKIWKLPTGQKVITPLVTGKGIDFVVRLLKRKEKSASEINDESYTCLAIEE